MRHFLLLYIIFPSLLFSQTIIDTDHFNEELMEELLLQKINEERVKKKLTELANNNYLHLAAVDHSLYQAKKDKMTHQQTSNKTKTPRNRVEKVGGKFKLIGENVAYSDIGRPVNMKIKNKIKLFETNTYEELADLIFQGWKYSPAHYANIVNAPYNSSGISVKMTKDKSRVYATQVFGTTFD